jgi:hypothetical protein
MEAIKMSAQTLKEAHWPMEAKYHAEIQAMTWGHLAPKRNRIYEGRIVFAIGCFGNDPLNPTALFCEFAGLDSSPWFFDEMVNFLSEQDNEAGCVYEFVGTFRNYEFKGQIRTLLDANTAQPTSTEEAPASS